MMDYNKDYPNAPRDYRDPAIPVNNTVVGSTPVMAYVISAAIIAVVVGAGAYFLASDFSSAPSTAQRPGIETPAPAPAPAPTMPAPAPRSTETPATPGTTR